MQKSVESISEKKSFFSDILESVRKNYAIITLSVIGFLALASISFLGITKNETVASFAIKEYEIGQIADRTIIAERDLSATSENPVSVISGEKVIRKGFPISEESYHKLEKMAESPEYIDYRAYTDSLIFFLLLIVLWIFLFSKVLLGRTLKFKELLTQIVFFLAIYSACLFASKLSFFASTPCMLCVLIPSSLFVFLIALLFGERSSVFFSIIVSLGVFNASAYSIEVFLFTFATCLSASRIVKKIDNRINMVFASLLIALLNVVYMFIFKVIFNDTFDEFARLAGGLAVNGFLSGILTLGLVTPLEQLLNTASVFRLMDLSDLNSPSMRKLLLAAPGTYNHSMMVATLAENACKSIGANALLARVAAAYHDIGKMDNPQYFTENRTTSENKHDEINPSLSVSIIRSHVKKGIEKARLLHMPQQVIDIIAEHHGNSLIAYFYNEAKKNDPNVNPEDYSYNGNPPSTRESAIIMLSDVVEAACHTLENPSVPRLDKFVQTLIAEKMEAHQLEHCDLTFNNITLIKESFVQILAGYYHSRIKYPDQKDPDSVASSDEKNTPKQNEHKTLTIEKKAIKTDRTIDREKKGKKNV